MQRYLQEYKYFVEGRDKLAGSFNEIFFEGGDDTKPLKSLEAIHSKLQELLNVDLGQKPKADASKFDDILNNKPEYTNEVVKNLLKHIKTIFTLDFSTKLENLFQKDELLSKDLDSLDKIYPTNEQIKKFNQDFGFLKTKYD